VHQPRVAGVRETAEQSAMHHTERGGIGTHAETDRDDREQ